MPSHVIQAGRFWEGRGRRGFPMVLPRVSPRGFRFIQRGQASLEILIVLLFLIPLIFGAIELSRGVAVKSSLDSGVGIAVRALSVDPGAWIFARDAVINTLDQNVFGTAGLNNFTVKIFDSSGTELSPGELAVLTFGAGFYIEASVEYTPQIPLLNLAPNYITLKAQHYGIIERIG